MKMLFPLLFVPDFLMVQLIRELIKTASDTLLAFIQSVRSKHPPGFFLN